MWELLDSLDRDLFLFINVTLSNPVTNFLMPVVTNDNLLRVMYAIAMILVLWKGNARARWMVLASALVLTATDQLSSSVIKPAVGRLRPCHVLEGINLLVGCGGGKAMPSSHAANAFGQGVLFSLQYPFIRWPLLIFAATVAVSRIFVGVHYPADIIVGAALGTIVATVLSFAFNPIYQRLVQWYREGKSAGGS